LESDNETKIVCFELTQLNTLPLRLLQNFLFKLTVMNRLVYYFVKLPSSSAGTSLEAIDLMAMKEVPFSISTIAPVTTNKG
jgi:hypothetical protein